MKENFVHLHCHSDASSLDGAMRIEDYVREVASRGNPAAGLADHGTLRGIFSLTENCDKVGIKPIYGVEFYVCNDMAKRGVVIGGADARVRGDETGEGDIASSPVTGSDATGEKDSKADERTAARKLFHLTAWALDNQGLKNLYKLTSRAWIEGFYYKPRIDLKALAECSEGIAVGTGCVGSVIYRHVVESRPREADLVMGNLFDIFSDRLYIEIMPHDFEGQRRANELALTLSKFCSRRLIATQDSHYLREEDAAAHDVLLAVGSHKLLGDSDRMRFTGTSYWLRTAEEIREAFARFHPYLSAGDIDEALDDTVELADRCSAKILIDPLKNLLPTVKVPEQFASDFAYLVYLVTQGMKERDLEVRAERAAERSRTDFESVLAMYTNRIKRELLVLRQSGFVSYFLLIHDMCRWAKAQGIARGPGRGSAAGSLVSFLLGITSVDPIEHRLMFERFIAPGRVNMPDVDLDFQDDRRGEVLDYLREKYGASHVAQISTIGRMNGRQALKDVARVFDVPYQRSQVAAAAISQDIEGGAIAEALARSEFFREFEREWPTVVAHAKKLEGLAKSLGVHPAGVVVSPVPLDEVLPLEARGADRSQIVTAFDMRGVEGLGLLKIDVLGLKAVSILEDARRLLADRQVVLDYESIPLDDQKVLDRFTETDFIGIFQFDTSSSYSVCDGLKFATFDDIAVVNAINRPGAIDFADEFKKRRAKPSTKDLFHPKVSEITADSLGIMIYQEHVIRVATEVAGFTPKHADALRKKIGKSEGAEAMEVDREGFLAGCLTTTPDMSRDTADKLFSAIVKFGRYSFNRSHSVCYSLLAYWLMYLKVHHTLEFYCSILRKEGDAKKIQRIVRDAKKHGVETLLPDVNISGTTFMVDYGKNAVRGALLEIKGVGPAAVEEIVQAREKGQFTDLIDFLNRAHGKKVTKRTVEGLARGGALDELLPNPRWFVTEFNHVWKTIERNKCEQLREPLSLSAKLGKWSVEDRLRVAAEVNPLALPPHPLIKWEPWIQENIKVPLSEVSDELLASEQDVYVTGVVTEVAIRSVGDANHEVLPDEETRRIAGWGKPWARFTVEGLSGEPVWVKIHWTMYDEFQPIVEKGEGTLVAICGRTRPQWRNLEAHFVADIEAIEHKLSGAAPLNIWERLLTDKYHPATTYPWESKSDARIARTPPTAFLKSSALTFSVIGVVAHLYVNTDRRNRQMGFFGIAGYGGYLNVLCFATSWAEFGKYIKLGLFAKFKLRKLDDSGSCVLDSEKGGSIQLLRKV